MEMLIEAEAIPFEAAPLRGERLLVLAPHPDDEVIGCGGLIALHMGDRRAVRVVVATDGTKATGADGDGHSYRDRREQECRRGLNLLGVTDIHFLRFPDRGLDGSISPRLQEHLAAFRPDLVCVPSPVEIHPDHLALSRAFCELVQNDQSLFADLATTRVAFYEVSQPLRPNALVDISSVAEAKYAAIAAHESQIVLKDYIAYSRGLNAYRAMTLPPEVKLAEAYWVTPLPAVRTTAFGGLRRAVGHPAPIDIVSEPLPVSVIIRTKERPELLREAIASVRSSGYPAEIVVVNDGGSTLSLSDVQLVEHETSRGRSEAMNSGVRAAKSKFIAFLDDDDLFYPEHLPVLTAAAAFTSGKAGWYSDALSAMLRLGPSGQYEVQSRQRLFQQDFDRDLLLIDNFIPLTSLLVTREGFLEAGGFDPAFDLFEDWDFLLRLSERGDLARVPRITCEVRHFEGGDSITLAAPEGSARFRQAKFQVWNKHRSRITDDVIAAVYERQKRRLQHLSSDLVDAKGSRSHAEGDLARLEREKSQLIREIQQLHESVNEKLMYIQQLETSVRELRGAAESVPTLSRENAGLARENAGLAREIAEIRVAMERTRAALQTSMSQGEASQNESERLQGLLDMVFQSKTWKLHSALARLRGRK